MARITSKTIEQMVGREVLDACQADSPLARVRQIFSENYAEIDQACRQRRSPGPLEIRRMELHAANRILELFGIALP